MKTKIPKYEKTIIKILSCFFVIFPWITYLNIMEYNDAEKLMFPSQSGIALDFFLQSKEMVLLIMTVGMLIFYFAERFLMKKKDSHSPLIKGNNKWLFIMCTTFCIFAIVATICSNQKKNAFWGSPTEGEGLWILMSYVVLILMFYNYFANEYGLYWMKKAIVAVSCITVFLAVVEFFYKPLLEIDFVKMLVAPAEYSKIMDAVEETVFSSAISLTFYNPNYLGGFVCLLLPFVVVMSIKEEKLLYKILLGGLCTGLMFCIVATNTTTAFYLSILEVVLVVLLFIWKEKSKKEVLTTGGILIAVVAIAAIVSAFITGNSIGGLLTNANSATGEVVEERFTINDIILKDNTVSLVGDDVILKIINMEGSLSFSDGEGNDVAFQKDGGKYDILQNGYEYLDVYIAYSNATDANPAAKIFVDAGYNNTIDFLILRDGSITGAGQQDAIIMDINGNNIPESFKRYYGIFTGRGYAWINSLPILKETILVGKGPGNFVYHFKQADYVGLLETHKNAKTLIDKPHNTYLQYAINLGIPGMMAFFGVIGISLWNAVKTWKKMMKINETSYNLHIGGIVAVFGFLIYSCVNDSMITVTPILCMLVGLLLATTHQQNNL